MGGGAKKITITHLYDLYQIREKRETSPYNVSFVIEQNTVQGLTSLFKKVAVINFSQTNIMNDVLQTIFDRRAVRKYKDIAVSKDLIEQLLDAGRMAPSAMNQQVWKFYVLTGEEDIKLFSSEIVKAGLKTIPKMGIKKIVTTVISSILHLAHGIDFLATKDPVFHGAPVVIFITAPKDNEWAALDIGMCAQNIMLAAKSLGVDTCPVGFGKFVEQTKHYPYLEIPKNETVHLAIALGYGKENPPVHERKKDNAFFK